MGRELFDNIPSRVIDLLNDVNNGKIGLPDLQRPFVWKDKKVRDLLDSMLKGYPIGYIMLWQSPENYNSTSQIGLNDKIYQQPESLVIDGQQRLTALLAAIKGVKVKNKDYSEHTITIAFNPLTREFAVCSGSIGRDPEWISSISEIFDADENHNVSKFRRTFINSYNASKIKNNRSTLTENEEQIIEDNINELLNLSFYVLPTIKINSKATEEDVADIFVRVNSGGQKLTEKNFIETLLAVYDTEVYYRINNFCAASRMPKDGTSYNFILKADPSHLIRMSVGLGFHRARLHYAYMLMRGKDLDTGDFSQIEREKNLEIFKGALEKVTNLNNWHAFMGLFADAGYVTSNIVSSSNAVVFSYVLYLIGKYEYRVVPQELQRITKQWIFMSTVTSFYTGSTESEVEKQFADLRTISTAEEFISYLESVISSRFTEDYFSIALPNALINSSPQSPAWFGYVAALNVLGNPMLFSTTPLAAKLVPGASGNKKAIDKHHIFPKHYLTQIGYTSDRDRNQIANFTYLDYATNIDISDAAPNEYAEKYRKKLGDENFKRTCQENALPENFDSLSYPDFLAVRRMLMAQTIREAYERLA